MDLNSLYIFVSLYTNSVMTMDVMITIYIKYYILEISAGGCCFRETEAGCGPNTDSTGVFKGPVGIVYLA